MNHRSSQTIACQHPGVSAAVAIANLDLDKRNAVNKPKFDATKLHAAGTLFIAASADAAH